MNSDRPISLARQITLIVMLLAAIPLAALAQRGLSGSHYGSVNLKDVPEWNQVGDWSAYQDAKLTDLELTELEPDDYLARTYADPNGLPRLDYLVVYGHLKKTFHEPAFCLPGGGFNIEKTGELKAGERGLPIRMGYFVIQKEIEEKGQPFNLRYVVFYTYLQGSDSTPNLAGHNWNLLRARMERRNATGAFMRVMVLAGDEEVAMARAADFVRKIYPGLKAKLHEVPKPAPKA